MVLGDILRGVEINIKECPNPKLKMGLAAIVSTEECSEKVRKCLLHLKHTGDGIYGASAWGSRDSQPEKGLHILGPEDQEGLGHKADRFRSDFIDIQGHVVLGHIGKDKHSPQPVGKIGRFADFGFKDTPFALVYDGSILNRDSIQARLMEQYPDGEYPLTDASIAATLIREERLVNGGGRIIDGIKYMQEQIDGAHNIAILCEGNLYVERDPLGVLPFMLGKGENMFAAASNDIVLRRIGCTDITDIEPGEAWLFNEDLLGNGEPELLVEASSGPYENCLFWWTYSGRLGAESNGLAVAALQEELGRRVWKNPEFQGVLSALLESGQIKLEDIIISSVPMSGNGGTVGAVHQAIDDGLKIYPAPAFYPSDEYIRSYIPLTDADRRANAAEKLDEVPHYIKDRAVVLIDDSLVRGTQTEEKISKLRQYNPKLIIVLSTHPKIFNPCHKQLSTRQPSELAMTRYKGDGKAIAKAIGADHFFFNSEEDYLGAFPPRIRDNGCGHCATPYAVTPAR